MAIKRSQPTYEELKQKMERNQKLAAVGSQPTYEELKRFFAGRPQAGLPKFSAYL